MAVVDISTKLGKEKKTIKISGTISNINLSAHYSKIDKKVV